MAFEIPWYHYAESVAMYGGLLINVALTPIWVTRECRAARAERTTGLLIGMTASQLFVWGVLVVPAFFISTGGVDPSPVSWLITLALLVGGGRLWVEVLTPRLALHAGDDSPDGSD